MQRISSLLIVLSSLSLSLCAKPHEALAGGLDAPVVGGTDVMPGEWPDVVAVFGADGSLCSGTLIASDLVLTAGHCIEGKPFVVIVGSVDLAQPDGEQRDVKWSRAYPDWEHQYDVGIIMLENPVAQKPRAVVQRCGVNDVLAAGASVKVVGFGLTTAAGTGNNTKMHEAAIPVVDPTCTRDSACEAAVAPGGEFVAGGNGADACFGDSGGPVFVMTEKGPALVGVVSRGIATFDQPCGEGGIYVRADKVVRWIESVSGRKLERSACAGDAPADDGGDAPRDDGGCNAGAAGAVEGGLALYYAALVVLGLRRSRRRRLAAAA